MRLRHQTQWEEANLRVGRFWVPNTFLRPYLNFESISLVVRSMVLPRKDAIFMVPRPLQKLGGDSPLCPHLACSNCRYGHPFVSMQMTRCESSVEHICELSNGSSREVEHQNVGILKGLKGEFIPTGPWLVSPIGGGFYPDESKTRYFTLTSQSAHKLS